MTESVIPGVVKVYDGGSASIELIPADLDAVVVEQSEHGRALFYNRTGKLSTIIFDPGKVDLRRLPQDEHLPGDAELVVLFNAKGITPEVEQDILPDA